MMLSQRFERLLSEEPRGGQDLALLPYPSHNISDRKSDAKDKITSNDLPEDIGVDEASTSGLWNNPGSSSKNSDDQIGEQQLSRNSFRETFISGWRAGLFRSFFLSFIALALNVAIYAWLASTYNTQRGSAVVMQGSCTSVHAANTGVHAALNVLSTMVLAASTYAAQGLTAPNRDEVDVAHRKGKWLEIGTSSVRNLLYVRKRNAWLWSILAFTSLPFHLFFNAVFFTTSQANQYAVAVVEESFFANTNFRPSTEIVSPERFLTSMLSDHACGGTTCSFDVRNDTRLVELLQDVRSIARNANFVRMEPQQCLQNYSSGFMRDYSDVVVVSSTSNTESPLLWTRYPQRSVDTDTTETNHDPFHWICHDVMATNQTTDDRCNLELAMDIYMSGNWTVYGNSVSHCFARRVSNACQLQFNGFLMIAVVVFGVLKVVTMGFILAWHPDGRFLRTLGDAIASFLEDKDPTTTDLCLVNSKQIRKHGFQTPYSPQVFSGKRPRWLTSANTAEFMTTIGISALYILVLAIALYFGVDGAHGTAFSNGLGEPDIQSLAPLTRDDPGSSGIVPTLIVANIPQLGFSFLFVVYTNIWSKLLAADEFDRVTTQRKGLRVSEQPEGRQRASHFFTLPARYALPLMGCSATLHWLCSQSFFMVRIDGIDLRGNVDELDQLVRLGYSSKGIVALIGVSMGLLVATVCIATFRRLGNELGETSMSVVISAACHLDRHEPESWLQAVQWGDVSGSTNGVDPGGVRHCAFTSGEVRRPVPRQVYQ